MSIFNDIKIDIDVIQLPRSEDDWDKYIINNIETQKMSELLNVGTKDFPIFTCSSRSPEFIQRLKELIKKYPKPFSKGLGKYKDFTAKIEF